MSTTCPRPAEGDNIAQPACYKSVPKEKLPDFLKGHCEVHAQCASLHLSGSGCNCDGAAGPGAGPQLDCCRAPAAPPLCTEPEEAALAFLDGLCSLADDAARGYGGGFCNGGFNWGPQGREGTIMSQRGLTNGGVPVHGVNCSVDVATASCKYNRVANADSNGDVVYEHLQWDLGAACGALKTQASCDLVSRDLGLCRWATPENGGGPACVQARMPTAEAMLPLCLGQQTRRQLVIDCAEEADGALCQPSSGVKLLGKCADGNCQQFLP